MKDAVAALGEALSLCPRSAEGWRLAGTLSIARFDFGGAASAAAALRRLDPAHPFAVFLEAQRRGTKVRICHPLGYPFWIEADRVKAA